MTNIFYYVTSHGYGHGVRTCSIANSLPHNYNITFRTTLPEHFFKEEMKREYNYISGEFDCGCLQSDGVTTNVKATLRHYEQIAARNRDIIDNEIALCKSLEIEGIIGDITPFAFEIAARCNIPSVAISNFSWYDIYNEYIADNQEFTPALDRIKEQYGSADLLIALSPALAMSYFKKRIDVGLVGRKGHDLKDKIISKYNLDPSKKTGLIYVGNFGMHTAQWKKLETFTDWQFVGVYPLPGDPSNFHLINKDHFRYQDLVASTDAMISKLGYGSVSECMLNGKPLIYLPRMLFAEYPVLEKAVYDWGGGIKIDTVSFYDLDWNEALDKAVHMRLEPVISSGIDDTVNAIKETV